MMVHASTNTVAVHNSNSNNNNNNNNHHHRLAPTTSQQQQHLAATKTTMEITSEIPVGYYNSVPPRPQLEAVTHQAINPNGHQFQEQQVMVPARKKRGPKAGAKRARLAAAAAAASNQIENNNNQPDPYAFHCDGFDHPHRQQQQLKPNSNGFKQQQQQGANGQPARLSLSPAVVSLSSSSSSHNNQAQPGPLSGHQFQQQENYPKTTDYKAGTFIQRPKEFDRLSAQQRASVASGVQLGHNNQSQQSQATICKNHTTTSGNFLTASSRRPNLIEQYRAGDCSPATLETNKRLSTCDEYNQEISQHRGRQAEVIVDEQRSYRERTRARIEETDMIAHHKLPAPAAGAVTQPPPTQQPLPAAQLQHHHAPPALNSHQGRNGQAMMMQPAGGPSSQQVNYNNYQQQEYMPTGQQYSDASPMVYQQPQQVYEPRPIMRQPVAQYGAPGSQRITPQQQQQVRSAPSLVGPPRMAPGAPQYQKQPRQQQQQQQMPPQNVMPSGYQPSGYAPQQVAPVYQQSPSPGFMNNEPIGEPVSYQGQQQQSTLLQQQLSRQRSQQQQQQQQQQPMQPQQRMAPRSVQSRQRYVNGDQATLPIVDPVYHPAYPSPQRAQTIQKRMVPGRSHNHDEHQQHQSHLLVGNPTPPLTPNGPIAPLRSLQAPLDDWHPHQQPAPQLLSPHGHNGPSPIQQQHQQQQQHQLGMGPTSSDHYMHMHSGPPPLPSQQSSAMMSTSINKQPAARIPQQQAIIPKSSPSRSMQQYVAPPQPAPLQQLNSSHQTMLPTANHQTGFEPAQSRLTLPLRDAPLLGPFKLDHDAQFTTKVFHLKPQLFDTLSKSSSLTNPQTATVVQELQLRTYLVSAAQTEAANTKPGDSLLASNNTQHNHHQGSKSSSCNWPELFQVTINQQLVHLNRNGPMASQKFVDVFQYCQPGDNVLEIQVNDCYCHHEFVLEPVDRPTLRAFMNSCYKSRMLSLDSCLAKLRHQFGTIGFVPSQHILDQLQSNAGICNEYLQQAPPGLGDVVTRVRVSLRCPISARRMRTPIRGPNCKHLQCADLENFLQLNKDKTQWSCPICSHPIPFNMLELDQHQMQILQAMQHDPSTDDILIEPNGQWQAYFAGPSQVIQNEALPPQAPQVAKSNGTFHPQPAGGYSSQQQMAPVRRPTSWQDSEQPLAVRRPPSAMGQQQGQRSANGSPLAKRPNSMTPSSSAQYIGSPSQRSSPSSSSNNNNNNQFQLSNSSVPHQRAIVGVGLDASIPADELSPLAAMERTIIQHEQQMGPPPFDPNNLASSPLAPAQRASTTQQQHQLSPAEQQQQHALIGSPSSHAQHLSAASPVSRQQVPASPAQQSPKSHQTTATITTAATAITGAGLCGSKPSTPLVAVPAGGPETPATPSNSMQPHASQQQLVASSGQQANVIDHAPLSNGSASAGSITSTSTMTPSGQSLGSVGMGGDSRCNTAPLPANQLASTSSGSSANLDDLIGLGASGPALGASSGSPYSRQANSNNQIGSLGGSQFSNDHNSQHQRSASDEQLLMSKFGSAAAVTGDQNGDIAYALEEAEWKQQLDRGKSEHLANFLNDPLMTNTKHHHNHSHFNHHHQFQQNNSEEGPNRMLSGGLHPSDDECDDALNTGSGGRVSDPINDLDHFAAYLDPSGSDDGAGLPPEDRILDIFER